MKSISRRRLDQLIKSHRKEPRERYLDTIIDLRDEGVLRIDEIQFTPTGGLEWFLECAGNENDRETKEHRSLKRFAATYLSETGSPKVVLEPPAWFGWADVGCKKSKRYVECGNVRIEKFIQAFGRSASVDFIGERHPKYDIARELVYVPYSQNVEYPPVTMLSFAGESTDETA